MIRIQAIKRLKGRVCGIFQMYHCPDNQVSLSGGDYTFMSAYKPGTLFSLQENLK